MQSLLTRLLLGGGGGFSPAALFSSGAEGVWYDPSDTSTLFQDPAGTTPVTAVEQPVGLMLDKSKGLVLGSELVTNGDFSNDTTGWSFQANATGSVVAGELQVVLAGSNNRATYQNETTVAGRWYKATATLRSASGQLSLSALDGVTVLATSGAVNATGSNQTFTIYFLATSTTTGIYFGQVGVGSTTTYFADNISVRELPGNHAISYNSTTARPTLSARVNLLTYSEEFDNGVWTPSNTTVTTNSTVAPDGTTTADTLIADNLSTTKDVFQTSAIAATINTAYTSSIYVKSAGWRYAYVTVNQRNSGSFVGLVGVAVDLETGTIGSVFSSGTTPLSSASASVISVGNGWYKISVSGTTASSGVNQVRINAGPTNNTSGIGAVVGGSIYIWGADLRPANIGSAVPAYQRIAAATDYDTNGFPKYLSFDGSDDGMSTPANLDLTSTDKVTVFSGVRKLSDAASAGIVELSSNFNLAVGGFLVNYTSAGVKTEAALRGNGGYSTGEFTDSAAPISEVLSSLMDMSLSTNELVFINKNGVAQTLTRLFNANNTGNFGAYPLYIGARNNASLWLNGYLYGLTVVGARLTTPQIESMESWTAQRTGITL